MTLRYNDPNMPWFWLNGELHPFEQSEEGYVLPSWAQGAAGDEGSDFRVADPEVEGPVIQQKRLAAIGYDPDDKRVNADQTVSIMNPNSGQYERAVAAGESGVLMPISMAQEQNLPIYQYATEPKEQNQWLEFGGDIAEIGSLFATAYGAGNLLGGGLAVPNVTPTPIDWASIGAAEDAAMGAAFTEAGGVIPAGAGVGGNIYGPGVQVFPIEPPVPPESVELGTNTMPPAPPAPGGEALPPVPGEEGLPMPPAPPVPGEEGLPMPPAPPIPGGEGETLPPIPGGEGGTFPMPPAPPVPGGEGDFWTTFLKGLGLTTTALTTGGDWLSRLFNVGTGLYGMDLADKQLDFAKQLLERSDPFASEREHYKGQLRTLMDDPSKLRETPGYNAGIQAVERNMARQGYIGSGNMMTELFDYGGKSFDTQVGRLAQLAGANATPGAGAQTAANVMSGGNAATIAGLDRVGYGVSGQDPAIANLIAQITKMGANQWNTLST